MEKITDSVINKIEDYTNSSIEILKLKAIKKTAFFTSLLEYRLLQITTFLFMLVFISIALSFWLGDIFENIEIGFLIVGGFYFSLMILFFMLRNTIKKSINDKVIYQLLNEKKDE